jgi:DNA-binding NarL/FixJ family response regulator
MARIKRITVLLADDHELVRQGLRTVLDKDEGIRVVGEARGGREAVKMARKLRPDVILMDISMPIMNGLEATHRILAVRPSTKIIILSAHVDDEYMERAKANGAVGYIAKHMSAEILAWTIHEVAMGRNHYNPVSSPGSALEGSARTKGERLTSRESELLKLVAEGSPKRQIAATLRISVAVVEKLLRALMAKLSISGMTGLANYAVASGHFENDVDLVIT